MATEFDSSGGSKKRRTEEEGERDRISALPEALQFHILGLLPFKSAIRTGALSTQWRELWTRRWPAPASLEFRLGPHDSPQPLLESLERRRRRRLDRFSLSFQIGQLKDDDFHRCLEYAAACAVADLDVHLFNANKISTRIVNFTLPPGANPHLARLSLTGIRVGPSRPYPVLEALHLHRVTISDETLFNLLRECPLLRTLDIRYCDLRCAYLTAARANLKNVTIVGCEWLTDVYISNLSSLRSFRYSGAYITAYKITANSAIGDLYICFGGSRCRHLRTRSTICDARGRYCKPRGCWLDTLVNVSNLTVLTLCSSVLRRVSAKARARSIAGNAASCKLQNLREVQLLMFATYNENMDDIMAFLMICCSPRLERLFLQLPTRSNQYKANEEPSESEEDGSEEELSEVEASEDDLSKGEESEEDQSGQEESEEDASEEDHPKEDYSEEQVSEDSQEDESEEDQSQDDESEEDHSQEDESEEHHSQEDESEEEESEKDHEDESVEEPLGDGCENLMLLKMTNFMGRHNEMQLVSFVLKKSACLNQLILFTPERVHPGGPQTDHLSTSNYLETKLLPLEKASPNVQIILSKPDVAATKPLHSETFVKV